MAQVQRRDQEAFTRLLDRHLAGLQKFLLRLTGNSADADEVAQEAFLRIWSHARRWQANRVKFTTWLYRIARNLAIDRHRKQRESTTDDLDDDRRRSARRRPGTRLAAARAADAQRRGAAAGTAANRARAVSLRWIIQSGRGRHIGGVGRCARIAAVPRTPNAEDDIAALTRTTRARITRGAAMHDTPMTLDEFETRLDRHGVAFDRWPTADAAHAERLLATSVDARTLLGQARDIASLLDDCAAGGLADDRRSAQSRPRRGRARHRATQGIFMVHARTANIAADRDRGPVDSVGSGLRDRQWRSSERRQRRSGLRRQLARIRRVRGVSRCKLTDG